MKLIEIILLLMNIIGILPRSGAVAAGTPKTWTYEIISVEPTSINPDKIKVEIGSERISRGVYAISGTFFINVDIADGDENMIEASAYRSPDGDEGTYKALPFKMPLQHVHEAMNGIYKNALMDTLKGCSNLPVFEDEFVPPLEKKEYILEKCQFSQDGFPNHLQEGFYKVIVEGKNEIAFQLVIVAKVVKSSQM